MGVEGEAVGVVLLLVVLVVVVVVVEESMGVCTGMTSMLTIRAENEGGGWEGK